MDASERAVEGQANCLVDSNQVRRLILQAQGAWRVQCSAGLAEESEGFDVWRKGVLFDAVRKTSFRLLTQREYGKALAVFLQLCGRDVSRFPARTRSNSAVAERESGAEGDRRRAMHALYAECEKVADVFGKQSFWYATTLLDKIHHVGPESATAKQIWQTIFTLRNRAASKRKSLAGAGEVHAETQRREEAGAEEKH